MTVDIKVLGPERIVVARYWGSVSIIEMNEAYAPVFARVSRWSGYLEIVDLESLIEVQMTPREIRELAKESADWISQNEISVNTIMVAPSDLAFGMARVYYAQASFSAYEAVHVVRTRSEAAAWLSIEEQILDQYMTH